MGCQDQYLPGIQQVDIAASSGSVPIVFPTTTIALVENFNGQVSVANGASTTLLLAKTTRKAVTITNLSGTTMFLAFGSAASLTTQPIPSGTAFNLPIDPQGNMFQGIISAFQASGGALNINVLELI